MSAPKRIMDWRVERAALLPDGGVGKLIIFDTDIGDEYYIVVSPCRAYTLEKIIARTISNTEWWWGRNEHTN